jgi:tRNA(Ile)-lysidine synthase
MSLVERITAFWQTAAATVPFAPSSTFVVGVSGGPDSLALLHLLVHGKLIDPARLVVAHLHHGLRPQADDDAAFVQATATAWGVQVVVEQVDVRQLAQAEGWTIEEAARNIRYRFLGTVAQQVDAAAILLAHHADDQVETVLLHLLRGSGLAGLRGILPIAPFPFPHSPSTIHHLPFTNSPSPFPPLLRPLLTTTRQGIETYCQTHQLNPVHDASNQDTQFQRNRIRHELLPLLESYNPQVRGRMRDLAEVVRADEELLRTLQEESWAEVVETGVKRVTLRRARWLALSLSLRRRVLRQAIERLLPGAGELSFGVLEQARGLAETGTVGQQMSLAGNVRLTLKYETVEIAAADSPSLHTWPQLPGDEPIYLPVPGQVALADGWLITAERVSHVALADIRENPDPWRAFVAINEGEQMWLRPRQAGERIQPLGLNGQSQAIKKVMNQRQIMAEARGRWPILATAQHPLWIIGHTLDHRAQVQADSQVVIKIQVQHTTK